MLTLLAQQWNFRIHCSCKNTMPLNLTRFVITKLIFDFHSACQHPGAPILPNTKEMLHASKAWCLEFRLNPAGRKAECSHPDVEEVVSLILSITPMGAFPRGLTPLSRCLCFLRLTGRFGGRAFGVRSAGPRCDNNLLWILRRGSSTWNPSNVQIRLRNSWWDEHVILRRFTRDELSRQSPALNLRNLFCRYVDWVGSRFSHDCNCLHNLRSSNQLVESIQKGMSFSLLYDSSSPISSRFEVGGWRCGDAAWVRPLANYEIETGYPNALNNYDIWIIRMSAQLILGEKTVNPLPPPIFLNHLHLTTFANPYLLDYV